jgi:hypothetical protein
MTTARNTEGSKPVMNMKKNRNIIIRIFAILLRIRKSFRKNDNGSMRKATLAPETATMCKRPALPNASRTSLERPFL